MELAPVILFTYNRLWHTQQTIEALKRNVLASDTNLYIFSDGGKDSASWKKVKEVREYIHSVSGFKKVELIERTENYGLAQNIIKGVSHIVNIYNKVIVVEDDIVTSCFFLKFMNTTLDLYNDQEDVISIHGYMYPVEKDPPSTFFLRGADCWGWATWKRGWKYFEPDGKLLLDELICKKLVYEFDFNGSYPYTQMLKDQINGKNDSWAIRWYASAFLSNKYTLYPGGSLVKNIGNDSSGTHSGKSNSYEVSLANISDWEYPREVNENRAAKELIVKYFKANLRTNFLNSLINFFR